MSSTNQMTLPTELMSMLASRLSMQLKGVRSNYVIRAISKERALQLGEEIIRNHYDRCLQLVRDVYRYRFREIREPTEEEQTPLRSMRRQAIRDWKAIINDITFI